MLKLTDDLYSGVKDLEEALYSENPYKLAARNTSKINPVFAKTTGEVKVIQLNTDFATPANAA